MKLNPKVSIIIPSYNSSEFLPEALESALNQDYSNFDIIIVDDGSTDQTAQIAKEYQKKDKRIKYIYQKNKGLGGARNTGIRNARSELIAHLDADDIYRSNYLSKTVDRLSRAGQRTAAVAPNAFFLTERPLKKTFYQAYQTPAKITLEDELERNKLPSSALIKKAIAQKIGLYKKTNYLEDHEFWIRLLINGYRIETEKMPLRYYRLHKSNLSVQYRKFAFAHIKLYRKLLKSDLSTDLKKIARKSLADAYTQLAAGYLFENRSDQAQKNFQEAFEIHPSFKTKLLVKMDYLSPALTKLAIRLRRTFSPNPQTRRTAWSQ